MDIFQIIHDLIFNYTLRTVALGSATLGLVSGMLGSFAFLRKQSLLGDAISHASLPGVVLMFMLTRSKLPIILIIGAAISGWVATYFMIQIVNKTRIKEDSALGLVLSVFFGLGMVLLTFTQRLPDARQAGLSNFLFGQAAAMLQSDVITMAILSAVITLIMIMLWKEFKLLSFDPAFSSSMGFNTKFLDILLTTLIVVAIVIGLQAVGVILMSAMIVAPAASARQWTDRLDKMVILSGFFGALAGITGTVLSSTAKGLSTGPTIVLSISVIFLVSMFFAPNRGILWNRIRQTRNQRDIHVEAVLRDLYQLSVQHSNTEHGHHPSVLKTMSHNTLNINRCLRTLENKGFAVCDQNGYWAVTKFGIEHIQQN